MPFWLKTMVSALIIASVSTISKKSPSIGAIVVSLPITSMLAILWLYYDTRDADKVMSFSYTTFWVVVPSLLFFIALPLFLNSGVRFPQAMLFASGIMVVGYYAYIWILRAAGISI